MASGPITSWQIDGESRDIILPTKACIVKSVVLPVVMCKSQSWTIKKAEHQRIDAFKMWCWRRLLRAPWRARRWLDSITESMDIYLTKLREIVKDREAWCVAGHGVTKNWTSISDWTEFNLSHIASGQLWS